MMRRSHAVKILGAALLALLFGCSSTSQTPSVPPKHPEDLPTGRVDCLECHKDVSTGALKPYANFRHSGVFIKSHGTYAPPGAEPVLLLPQAGVLPDVPRRERGA